MSAFKTSRFSLELYEFLRGIYSEEESRNAIELADNFVEKKIEDKLIGIPTNDDLNSLKLAMKADIHQLDLKISNIKSDIRWMFGILIVFALMIIGLYFKK